MSEKHLAQKILHLRRIK